MGGWVLVVGWGNFVGEVSRLGRMRSLARRESYDACYACALLLLRFKQGASCDCNGIFPF